MQWLEPRPARRLPIRLTPLIDVVFILLLFFMLSSRMDPMGLMELETASADGSPVDAEQTPAELHLRNDGALEWNGTNRDAEAIRQSLTTTGSTRVFLSTGSDVALSEFTHWLSEIQQAGLEPQWRRGEGARP